MPDDMQLIMESWRGYCDTSLEYLISESKKRVLSETEQITLLQQLILESEKRILTEEEQLLLEVSMWGAIKNIALGIGKIAKVTGKGLVGTGKFIKNPKRFISDVNAKVEAKLKVLSKRHAEKMMKDERVVAFIKNHESQVAEIASKVAEELGTQFQEGNLTGLEWQTAGTQDWAAFGQLFGQRLAPLIGDAAREGLKTLFLTLTNNDIIKVAAEELKEHGIPVTEAQKATVGMILGYFLSRSSKQIVFGFIDNFLMVLFGRAIDEGIAAGLAASGITMSPAINKLIVGGLGNTFSDAVGEAVADWVENYLDTAWDYIPPNKETIEGSKVLSFLQRWAGVVGITIGCLLGLVVALGIVKGLGAAAGAVFEEQKQDNKLLLRTFLIPVPTGNTQR